MIRALYRSGRLADALRASARVKETLATEPDAARIEPRTPEGEVYVTHPFAALAALAGDLSIACQYVGTLPTAKGLGSLPVFALHRKV